VTLALSTGVEADGFQLPKGNGAYEWWYFDAIDRRNGLALIVIFFRGIPFSGVRQRAIVYGRKSGAADDGANYPAMAFSLYGPESTDAYLVNLHPADSLVVSQGACEVRIGESTARLENGCYELDLSDVLLDGTTLQGKLSFTPSPAIAAGSRAGGAAAHEWVLAAPRCEVRGDLLIDGRKIDFDGVGYHDHNIGESSLQAQFRSWEWGRVHFAASSFIYYRAEGHDGSVATFAITVGSSGSLSTRGAEIATTEWSRNVYRVEYPLRFEVTCEDGTAVKVHQRRIIDNGPFYLRFLSEFESESGEVATGFSEILRPRALGWRWFWPLLDSRVRPTGSRDVLGRRITQWLIRRGF